MGIKFLKKLFKSIFEKALNNLEKGNYIDKQSIGTNYKLPSNRLCIIFTCKEISNLFDPNNREKLIVEIKNK